MTTTDNNKLLAEFLGYTQPHPDYPHTTYWYKKDEAPLTMLSFDTDWNWLMEVVEKIENYNEFTSVLFAPQGCAIDVCIENGFAFSNDCNTKIEAVYNACIAFVQWYNSSKEA
jgi:hypothetical protein